MNRNLKRILAITFLLVVVFSGTAAYLAVRAQGTKFESIPTALEVMALVKTKYVDPIGFSELVKAYTEQGTISGMLKTLDDPYTRFMNKTDYTTFKESTEGTFAGIGVTVDIQGDYVVVVQPFKGTPGERAGLKPGDLIIAVDGKSTKNMALDAAVSMIRGPAGTTVVLTVERTTEGRKDVMEFRIVRALIHVPTVEYKTIQDKNGLIGYVTLRQYTRGTSKELSEALAELKAAGVAGLMLDLRYNPGGLLDEAVDVCAQFLPDGPVLYVVDRSRRSQAIQARMYRPFGKPLVVLVNEWSASASEITAGALQDRKVGTLVGKTTFGKGVVQTIYPLTSGGGLSLTTSRYLTAAKRSIHKTGIAPDVEVDLPENAKTDLQYEEALRVLRTKIAGG